MSKPGVKIMPIVLILALVGLFGLGAAGTAQSSSAQSGSSQEDWRKEFDDICSKTQDAMTFSQEELIDLIRRCDALVPQIEKLEESQKKVYAGRLRMCRGVYAYVLDAKKNEKK